MIRRPPRSTPLYSSAASDVYKRQGLRFKSDWLSYTDFIFLKSAELSNISSRYADSNGETSTSIFCSESLVLAEDCEEKTEETLVKSSPALSNDSIVF